MEEKNLVEEWLYKNGSHYNYDAIPELLKIMEENKSPYSYYNARTINLVLNHLNKITNYYNLKEDFELMEEYYDVCFKDKKIRSYLSTYLLTPLIYLNEFSKGKNYLKKQGIDLYKQDKLREALFDKYLHSKEFTKCKDFAPKELDSKKLLDKHLSIELCQFLNERGIEIPKEYLCQLLKKVYLSIVELETFSLNRLNSGEKIIDKFTNLLLENASFVNYVAPAKNINLAIYNYFDKEFMMPRALTEEEIKDPTRKGRKLVFENEFSTLLYNNPGFRFLNLKTKVAHKVNMKFSGKKFVPAEVQQENLEKEEQNSKVSKRIKV